MKKLLNNQMINKKKTFMKRVRDQLLILDKSCIKLTHNVKDHNFQKLSFMKLNSLICILIKLYRNKH